MSLQLVTLHGRKATTTSLLVAERFGKRHDHVVRDIRKLMADLPNGGLPNFEESYYINEQNKKHPMYEMTRDGFSLLAMGFTGKKALQWKLKFLEGFNFMEQSLLNQQNLSWQEARTNSKVARREETDVIQKFIEYAVSQGSKNSSMYYMNITSMTYKALFLVGKASPQPFRNLLNSMQLSFLTTAEYLIQAAIEEGMKQALHYKQIYTLARDRVVEYAQRLPQQRLEVRSAQNLLF